MSIAATSRSGRTAVVAAIALCAVAFCAFEFHRDPRALLSAWLFAWWFVLGLPLGAIVLQMIHNLTGGEWGRLIRAPLALAQDLLPVVLLLSIPLWAALPDLYPWAGAEGPTLPGTHPEPTWYLHRSAFALREALCFVAWVLLLRALRRAETRADAAPGSAQHDRRVRATCAVGLIVYALTITVAAVDWIMSLTPRWMSTTFGLLAAVGQVMGAFALVLALAAWNHPRAAADPGLEIDVFHDLGNLLLTFVMLWAYLAYTQYLIIWAEDLPREIAWYLPRVQTSWRWLGIGLVVGQFALPFVLLLSRAAKRSPQVLGGIAALVLAGHLADAYWLVAPSTSPGGFTHGWDALAALIVCAGACLGWSLRSSNRPTPVTPAAARAATEASAGHG